ncbi:MAG: HAD family hydrolase [Planctomycetia bacterium]
MPTIDAVLLDLGNVLVDFSHERMIAQVAEVYNRPEADVREAVDAGLLADYETGRLSDAGFHAAVEKALGRTAARADLLRAWSDIFVQKEEMNRILDKLKASGLRMVLLSNTSPAHIAFLRGWFPPLSYFHDLVLSYEVGAMKPDPKIFAVAADKIGCAPDRCFYTDDLPGHVDAARRAGFQAEVFKGHAPLREQLAAYGVEV